MYMCIYMYVYITKKMTLLFASTSYDGINVQKVFFFRSSLPPYSGYDILYSASFQTQESDVSSGTAGLVVSQDMYAYICVQKCELLFYNYVFIKYFVKCDNNIFGIGRDRFVLGASSVFFFFFFNNFVFL